MIQRIRTLEVEDFRAYKGTHGPVNMDGDVVLIYGQNGSGKTSLLHAIEYAVTGRVEHLAEFRQDYPEKLSHHPVGGDPRKGRVRLVASVANSESDHTIERTVGASKPTEGRDFPGKAKTFYAGRSYLSQAHLGRLLNIYQESKGVGKVSPIVQFIRDFLELGRLEAIEDGLHKVGHKARLEKEYRSIVRVKKELEEAIADAAARRSDAATAEEKAERATSKLAEAATAAGVPVPEGVPDYSDFDLELAKRRDDARTQAHELTQWREVIRAQDGLDSPPPTPPAPDPQKAYATLGALARTIDRARQTLGQPVVASSYEPPNLVSSRPGPAHLALVSELDRWRGWFDRTRSALTDSRMSNAANFKRAQSSTERLTTLQRRNKEILAEIATLGNVTRSAIEAAGSLREGLTGILPHIHDDNCPVCNRDFSETGRGDLKAYVVSVLDALGVQTARLQEQLDQRERLVAQRAQIEDEVSTLAAQSPADRLDELQIRMAEIDQTEAEINKAEEQLDALATIVDEYAVMAHAAEKRTAWIRRREVLSRAIRSTHALLNPGSALPSDRPITDAILSTVSARAIEKAATLSEQADALDRVIELAEVVRTDSKAAASARRASASAEAAAKRAKETSDRVDDLVQRANAVRRAAGRTTRKLIEETFDKQLNSLVNDVYLRLVRDEQFLPWITSKGSIRSLTAAVNAYAGSKKVAEDIASVVSSANLNTAALSLFIGLHIASSAEPGTLVLDDPVQSMDDIHATNLAALFRTLAYHPTSPRQLILALHDKALFEYLAFELGPTKAGETLVEVRVTRESEGKVAVRSVSKTWQPDQVVFGSTDS